MNMFRLNKIKKSALICTGFIFFIILALYLLPLLYKKNIEAKAKTEVNNSTNAQINFDRVSLSFFTDFPNPTLSLHDLNIIGEHEFAGDTLADVKEAAIEISLWSLLFGKETELKSVHLQDARFDVLILKNGNANYDIFIEDTITSKTSDSTGINLALDNIKISNGYFIFRDKMRNTFMEMKGMNYEGSGDFQKDIFDFNTSIAVTQMSLIMDKVKYLTNKEVELNMIMEMNLKENKYSFKKNTLRINHFQVGFDGFLKMLSNGYDMDLKFAANQTEFKDILSLIPGIYMHDFKKINTKGEIAFSGFVKGLYKEDSISTIPSFHVAMKIKDAMFKIDTLPTPVENIQMDLVIDNKYNTIDSTIFELKQFHLDMGKHPVDGRLRLKGINNYSIDTDIKADMELEELEAMYPIKGLKLKGKIDFTLKANGKYSEANNVLKEIPSFHLDLKLDNGKIKFDSLPTSIKDIQFHLLGDNKNGKLESTILNIKNIHMDMGGNPVHGYAKIEGYENYFIDTDIKANLNLADIEKMYPIEGVSLKGLFDLDIKAKGEYNNSKKRFPSIDAKMNLTDGYMLFSDYPEPLENIHLISEAINKNGNLSDTKLTIEKLTYTMEGEPFEIKGTVADLENYVYDLKIKGQINLEKITKIYPIEGVNLSGIIDTDMETKGRVADLETGNYERTSSEGSIEMKDLKVSGDDIPVPIKINDALFVFTPTKIVLKKLQGKLGKGNINLSGDLYNYMSFLTPNDELIKGDLHLVCDTINLNQWLAKKKVKKGTTDTTHAASSLIEVPRNIDFIFDSYVNVVLYQDMILKRMKGEIKIRDGVLTFKETGFNSLNALFRVNGDYNTKNIKHPLFDLDIDIKELDINKAYTSVKLVQEMAPAMADAYGIFSVTYKIKGEVDKKMSIKTETLVGEGEIRVAEAKINGMKIFEEISKSAKKKEINDPHLKDLLVKTKIKDNQLQVLPFEMKISGFDAEIEGTNDISGVNNTIHYIVKLQLLPIDKLKIPFHVTGTYDDPKVALGKGHKLPE
jgi:AsmA protein